MQNKQQILKKMMKQLTVWFMVLVLLAGTIPAPTLFALSEADLPSLESAMNVVSEGVNPVSADENAAANDLAGTAEEAVAESSANDAPLEASLETPLAEEAVSDVPRPVAMSADSARLAPEDVVVEDGVLVALTEAGEAKVASLQTLTIPSDLGHTIGERLLVDHTLTNLILEEGIVTVQNHAFQRTGIRSVTLPDSLKTVGDYAFADNALTTFTAKNIKEFGAFALYNNELTTIESAATTVGEKAFAANRITEARLPEATFLGKGAFFINPKLETVYMKNAAVTAASFPEPAFDQTKPVSLYLADTVTGVEPLNDSYVINPVTLTISFKDKQTQGLIQPTPNAENAAKKWTNSVRVSKHSLSEFPLTLSLPVIDGYRLSEKQEGVNNQDGTLTVPAAKIQDSAFKMDVYFDVVDKPQILVSDNKQLIWPVDKELDAQTILQDVRFLTAAGKEFAAFEGGQLKAEISIIPLPLPAPNQEGAKTVNVRFNDPQSNLSTDIDITFTYSNKTDENEEIIPGKGWIYGDFQYETVQGNVRVTGFSPSGLTRLTTDKNVVLPDYEPVSKQKVAEIGINAFKGKQIDTVEFAKMESLQIIRTGAFQDSGLKGLLNFNKLANLTRIDSLAFANLESGRTDETKKQKFTEIDFTPLKKLTEIGMRAFKGGSLEKVTLTDLPDLHQVGVGAFSNNELTEAALSHLPNLRDLSNDLFRDNPALSTLTLNHLPALLKIGNSAFKNTNLNELALVDFPELTEIDESAFNSANLENLRFEKLPNLQVIKLGAFGNNRLTDVNFKSIPSLQHLSGFDNNLFENIVLKDLPQLSSIDRDAFSDNLNLNGEIVLENLPNLVTVDLSAFSHSDNRNALAKLQRVVLRGLPLLQNIKNSAFSGLNFSELVLADLPQLREIAASAFLNSEMQNLTLENLPQLETIGARAFVTRNGTLESLTLKNLPNLRKIDKAAFADNKIKVLRVEPEDVPALTTIDSRAFSSTSLKGTFDAKKFPALEEIGNFAFVNTYFSDFIFNEHPTLRRIKDSAFNQLSDKVTSLDFSNMPNLEAIEKNAFAALSRDKKSLTSVRVTNNPNLVELGGFANNLSLTDVVLENLPKLEKILDSAFKIDKPNAGIVRLDLTPFTTLKTIGREAFANTSLSTLELPDSVENIEASAYSMTGLQSVDLTRLTNLKTLHNGAFDKGFKPYEKFILPETAEPIILGKHIAYLTADQLDFSKTPGVKVKLTTTQPFRPTDGSPLVMHFDNDDQITWDPSLFNIDPANPTVIYIDKITNPDRLADLPQGLLINPGKVTVEHVEDQTNRHMGELKPITNYLRPGMRLSAKNFAGYRLKEVQSTPDNVLERQGDTDEYAVVNLPQNDSAIRFVYEPLPTVESPHVHIEVNYASKYGPDFIYHQPYSTREFEVSYTLTQVDVEKEKGSKFVITLPPIVAPGPGGQKPTDVVGFPATLPNYTLAKKPYYIEETRQIVYEIASFDGGSNPPPITFRVGFKVAMYDTPKKIEEHVRAGYYLPDGRRKGDEGVSPVIRPDYELPKFAKKVNNEINNRHTYSAPEGSNNEFVNASLRYTFHIENVWRRLGHVELKDVLPTYKRKNEDGSVVTVPAVFDPAKNPEWTVLPDGTYTTSVGLEALNASIVRGLYSSPDLSRALPALVLDFPRAVPQQIDNNASLRAVFHNKQAQDPDIELTAQRRDSIEISPVSHMNNFTKSLVGRNFIPGDNDPLEDFDWLLHADFKKSSHVFEGETFYYRTQYKDMIIWDAFDSTAINLLRFAGFTPNHPVTLELYTEAPKNMSRPEKRGQLINVYHLPANQRFDLSDQESKATKSVRFKYEPIVDSDDYVTDLRPEEKNKSDRLDFELNIKVHSRLRPGKTVPNANMSYRNRAFFGGVRAFPDNTNLADSPLSKSDVANRSVSKGIPKIRVTKTSDNYPSSNDIYRTDLVPLDYTLGFIFQWSNASIPQNPPFQIKNFNLVDIFPSQLDLKDKDITLHPDFIKYGGTYRREKLADGNTKLIFHAPTVLSNLPWVAKLNTTIAKGTPGDMEIINRAYIKTDDVPGYKLQHENAKKTPEENNASLTTATLRTRFALNSAGTVQKFIRSATKNGGWQKEIKTQPREDIEYKVVVSNTYRTPINKFTILDVLPHVDDIEVGARLDGSRHSRGSQFSNIMTSAGLTSVVALNYLTNKVTEMSPQDFPFVMFSKLDGFPRNAAEGEARAWVQKALADPSYQTTDPAQAKAIYFGGENTSIPPTTRIEFVFKAKVPDFDLNQSEKWRGFVARNSLAYSNERQPEYREVEGTTNTLETPTRSIKFRKIASDTKLPVGGATFVLKQRGVPDKVAVSDKEGWLYFADIYYLPITLQEISAPKGYQINEQVFTYEGLNKELYDADMKNPAFDPAIFYPVDGLVFENTPIPPPDPTDKRTFSFNITKKDGKNDPLPYVRFRMENMADGSVMEEVTNATGQVLFGGLRPGQYRLSEVSNINRYTVIKPVYLTLPLPDDFTSDVISALTREKDPADELHEIYRLDIPNERFSLDLQKIGIEDLAREKQDHQLVSGDGIKLPEVQFKLYETEVDAGHPVPDTTGTLVADLSTDAKGKAKIENLKPNRIYRLEETVGFEGYERREKPIYFYLDAEGGVKNERGEDYVRPDLLLVSNIRETVKTSASVKKIDAATGAVLPGAKFQIFKLDGDRYVPLAENSVRTTNDMGMVYFNDLEYGRYRIIETEAPSGYVRSAERHDFTAQPYGKPQHLEFVAKNKKLLLKLEKVQKIAGPYTSDAAALENKEREANQEGLFVANKTVYRRLRGAQFKVTPKYVDPLTNQPVPETALTPSKTQDDVGYTVYEYSQGLSDLGAYLIEEVVSPTGYKAIEPFTVKMDQLVSHARPEKTLYIENTPKTGSVNVYKFADVAHTILPGVTFAVYKGHLQKADLANHKQDLVTPLPENRRKDVDSLTEEERYGITNGFGMVGWPELEMGEYTLVEIATVKPYKVMDEVTHFTLTDNQPDRRFSFYNSLDTITLKLNKQNDLGEPITDLQGARFDLYIENKLHSTGQISDKEPGMVIFEQVPATGEYEIREITAPKGYAILGRGVLTKREVVANNLLDNKTGAIVLRNKRQISISAAKEWSGGAVNARPHVYFKLYRQAEGEPNSEAVPNAPIKEIGKNNAKVDFGLVDAYKNENGVAKAYTYSVQEVNAAGDPLQLETDGGRYVVSAPKLERVPASAENENIEHRTITLKNTYQSKKVNLRVKKTWTGGQKAEKPNFRFVLYRKVGNGEAAPVLRENGEAVTLPVPKPEDGVLRRVLTFFNVGNQDAPLEVVFEELDVTDDLGQPYTYYVKEETEDGREIDESITFRPVEKMVQAKPVPGNDAERVVELNNVYHAPTTTVIAEKRWVHGSPTRPETHFFLRRFIKRTGIMGTTYKLDITFKSESKTLASHENDGQLPDRVEFANLPTHNDAGEELVYESVEFDGQDKDNLTWAPENYQKEEGTPENDNALLTTNTYHSPKSPLIIRTVWMNMVKDEIVPKQVNYILARKTPNQDYVTVTEPNAANPGDPRITSKEKHKTRTDETRWETGTEEVDETDENGTPYRYNVTATDVPGYSKKIVPIYEHNHPDGKVIGFEIRLEPVTIKKKVSKVWENKTDEPNPDRVILQIERTRDGKTEPYGDAAEVNEQNQWQHTFENLPTHDENGNPYGYSVREEPVMGYEAPVVVPVEENGIQTGFEVRNTRRTKSIQVTKTWNDSSDEVDKPSEITILLIRKQTGIAEETEYKSLKLSGPAWSGQFDNLPIMDNEGLEYIYRIEELSVPGYESVVAGNSVTNTRELTTVPVTKIWQEVEDGQYPTSITYILKRGTNELARQTVNRPVNPAEANAWNYTFEEDANHKKLARTNPATGEEYVYTVEEVAVPGYTAEINDENPKAPVITNTQQKKEIVVKKRWLKGAKPDVSLTLKRTVEGAVQAETVMTLNTEGQDHTTETEGEFVYTVVTFKPLRLPTHDPSGKVYTYTVEEEKVPKNYTSTKSADSFVVTNTYTVPKGPLQAQVNWVHGKTLQPTTFVRLYRKLPGGTFEPAGKQDETVTRAGKDDEETNRVLWQDVPQTDEDGNEYSYEIRQVDANGTEIVPASYTTERKNPLELTNVFNPPAAKFSFRKTWELQAGEQVPKNLQLTLKRTLGDQTEVAEELLLTPAPDGRPIWFRESQNAHPLQTIDGETYTYTVEEANLPGFKPGAKKEIRRTVEGGVGEYVTGFELTNIQKVRSIEVEKAWVNATNEPNPTTVTIELWRGNDRFATKDLTAPAYKAVFENLPTHDADGQAYVYTVKEKAVPAYRALVLTAKPLADGKEKVVVTNTRVTKSIEVTKTWKDEAADTDKPDAITILLKRKRKDSAEEATVYDHLVLRGAENEWKGTFDNLPTTDNEGVEYIYTIDEVPVPGYDKVIQDYSVTNTRQLTTVPVSKTWTFADAEKKDYPQSITYILKRDGVEIARQKMQPQDPAAPTAWNHTFTVAQDGKKLALYRPRSTELYTYTVEEVLPTGYQNTVTPQLQNGHLVSVAIENEQEAVELTLVKRWLNGKKEDVELEVQRRAGEQGEYETYKKFVLQAADGREETIGNETYIVTTKAVGKVAKYSPTGERYSYKLVEHLPDTAHYLPTYDEPVLEEGKILLAVTNTYQAPKGRVEAKKIWKNLHNDLYIPEIQLQLYRRYADDLNGEPVPQAEVKILPAFEYALSKSTLEVEVSWDEIEQADKEGKPYVFYVRELTEDGEDRAPDNYFRYQSKTKDPLHVINEYTPYSFPPLPDPNQPSVPGEDPNKDRVPNTGAARRTVPKR